VINPLFRLAGYVEGMKTRTQHFDQTTRNWVIGGAVLLCFAFAAFGQANGAPWYWVAIVGLPALALLASWFAATRGGWSVSPAELYFHTGESWDLRLRPEQVIWAEVIPDSEGPDAVRLHLQSGSVRELPDFCVGRASNLAEALRGVGVEVRTA
jgi:hypothetical protein